MANSTVGSMGGVAKPSVSGSEGKAGSWRPQPSSRWASSRQRVSALTPLFVLSFVIPIFFFAGPLRLAPFLLILLAAFLPLSLLWATGRFGGVRAADLLVLFSCLWGAAALVKAHGVGMAIEPAGVLIVQTFGAYLVGRCLVRNKEGCYAIFKVFFAILLLLTPFAILETRNSNPYYLDLFSFLGETYANVNKDPRMGLERVQGAFEHPILFGVFVSSGFAVMYYTFRRAKRVFALFLSTMLTILSVSVGAIVCLATQWILIGWGYIFRNKARRWKNFAVLTFIAYVAVDIISNRTPFHVFVDYLTFNQGSAYNRILIWEFGTAEVWRQPFFGIGLHDWTRPEWMRPSMDNFWLVIAVRYGLPALAALAGAFVLILYKVGRRAGLDEETTLLRRGMIISLIGVLVAIGSVHLWNATFCWLMFLLGSLVWMMDEGHDPTAVGR